MVKTYVSITNSTKKEAHSAEVVLDTGATISCIAANAVPPNSRREPHPYTVNIKSVYQNHTLIQPDIVNLFRVKKDEHGNFYSQPEQFIVLTHIYGVNYILGLSGMERFKIYPHHNDVTGWTYVDELRRDDATIVLNI